MGNRVTGSAVICVGHAALDRVYTVDAWPQGSGKVAASRYEESRGGMAANAAVAVARLGGRALFCGPTGDDATSTLIAATLSAEGVDSTWLRRLPGRTTSTSAVLVDARGERLVVGYRGTALQSSAEWLPVHEVARGDALLVDVRWPAGAVAALDAARAAGVPAILDGEIAPSEVLGALVVRCEHAIFSERGLHALAPGAVKPALRSVIARGVQVAAVTHGEHGVTWVEAATGTLSHCAAFAVTAVDTLAAGDVFHGAYALCIARGRPVRAAMRFASAAAAIKCTRPGGRNGAPTLGEVEAFLASRTPCAGEG